MAVPVPLQPPGLADVDRSRDDDEVALVHAAAAAGVPLLGVCRGLQVLVVAFGGTLVAHLDGHVSPRRRPSACVSRRGPWSATCSVPAPT